MLYVVEFYRKTREETLRIVSSLAPSQLEWRSSSGVWSLGQIADHLILTEEFYWEELQELFDRARKEKHPVVQRSFADFDVTLRYFPRFMHPFLELPLNMANVMTPRVVRELLMRFPLLPADNPMQAEPRSGISKEKLVDRLRETRERMTDAFERASDLPLHKMTHRHPFLGSNTPLSLLRLLVLHEERHQRQMKRILRTGW